MARAQRRPPDRAPRRARARSFARRNARSPPRTGRRLPARGRQRRPGAGRRHGVLGPRLRAPAARAVGEVCFNTSITGYQEILTDPSYAGQIITFTFPHIGNVGTNPEDIETSTPGGARPDRARRHHRAVELARRPQHLERWLQAHEPARHRRRRHPRADAPHPRPRRAQRRHRLHAPTARLDTARALQGGRRDWPGLEGMDLASDVTCTPDLQLGRDAPGRWAAAMAALSAPRATVVAVDYGAKRNILRCLADARLRGHRGAGDGDRRGHPAPQARRRVPVERPGRPGGDRRLRRAGDPRADRHAACRCSASASATSSWRWRSAPRPRKMRSATAAPTIRSRTCRPARSRSPARTTASWCCEDSLPEGVEETHVSLFDGSVEGIRLDGQAGVLRAVPPGGLARPAGQPLPVRALHRDDRRAAIGHRRIHAQTHRHQIAS